MMATILLQLDSDDFSSIQNAIGQMQRIAQFRGWPESASGSVESNIAGIAVAEICRSWMELMEAKKP